MRVITGTARGVPLKAPKGMDTRPTMDQVKEGIFSAIQFEVEGRRALDLFAGSGQLGIEALSRGAAHCTFVDKGREPIAVIRENLKKTRLEERATVVQADYSSWLKTCRQQYDLILLDPPYAEVFLETALKIVSEIDILTNSGIIVCERPFDKSLPEQIPGRGDDLPQRITVWRTHENSHLSRQLRSCHERSPQHHHPGRPEL